ncbi:MAG: polysaccharide biosynthesis protein [Corallococcus sp.]|nr:polysaccharide biosynthesis protein [Corallococcus sp.]
MKAQKQGNLITGALLISLGGLLAKILGALYRIPLTNIIGSYGMGLYQLVFPPYILFLTISQAGIPVALSKLIAEKHQLGNEEGARKTFRYCFFALLLTGAMGGAILAAASPLIASAQGNTDTTTAFLIIAPALLFVPVTNVFKGYFQGRMNMLPSSVTTVVEQVVKLIVGLICAKHFMPDVVKAVYGATFAITVSEFVSLVIMATVYLAKGRDKTVSVRVGRADISLLTRETMSLAFPVALGAFVMQMSQVIDSVMVVNLLTVGNATNMYGLWTGPVNSMLGLPIALSAGVAVSALPSITRTFVEGDNDKLRCSLGSAIKLTAVIALPTSFGMIAMSHPIISLLYGSLPSEEIYISSLLLALSGISIVFLAIMQTSVSVLQAVGKPYVSVIILAFAIVVKAVANLILLPIPTVNIYGAAISETLCYLFAAVSVIIYMTAKLHFKIPLNDCLLKPLACSLIMTLVITLMTSFASDFVNSKLGTLVTIAVAGVVYFVSVFALKVFDKSELKMLPVKQR